MPTSTEIKDLGRAVTALREDRRITRYALARKAGVSYRTVRLLEAGKINPTLEILLKIAKALGAPVDQLLRFSRSKKQLLRVPTLQTVPPRILALLRQPRTRHLLRVLKEARIQQLRGLIDYLLLLASPKRVRR